MALPTIEAKHRGKCGLCLDWILEGDLIVKVEGEWCHEDCAEAEEEAA